MECLEEINEIRMRLQESIIENDWTLEKVASLVGYKSASSVHRFLTQQISKPPQRRLYRIKKLIGEAK